MMTPKAGNMDSDRETGYYIETMLEAMYLHKKIEFQYTEVNEKLQKVLRNIRLIFMKYIGLIIPII